ncbi:MAG: hypothetical protein PHI81_08905, partial [Synergistaceae bacterium]|nr:hypothetical protein [Synergistaceae bacterium]
CGMNLDKIGSFSIVAPSVPHGIIPSVARWELIFQVFIDIDTARYGACVFRVNFLSVRGRNGL